MCEAFICGSPHVGFCVLGIDVEPSRQGRASNQQTEMGVRALCTGLQFTRCGTYVVELLPSTASSPHHVLGVCVDEGDNEVHEPALVPKDTARSRYCYATGEKRGCKQSILGKCVMDRGCKI